MRRKHISFIARAAFAALAVLLLPVFVLAFLNNGTIAFGVSMGPLHVGAQNPATARQELLAATSAYLSSEAFSLDINGTIKQATPKELGISVDIEQTVQNVFAVGRSGNVWNDVWEQVHAALFGTQGNIVVVLNATTFEAYDRVHLADEQHPAKQAALLYDDNKKLFSVSAEESGFVIDLSSLTNELKQDSAELKAAHITLALVTDIPSLTQAMVEPLKNNANGILVKAPLALTWDLGQTNTQAPGATITNQYLLDKNQLKDLLSVGRAGNIAELRVDESQLHPLLVGLIPAVNTDPKNAILSEKNGKVTEFTLSKNGLALDVEKSLPDVESGILSGDKTISLAVNITPPLISTETIENLGLVALIGEGESDFRGSPASRIANIKLGAQKMNGSLIPPGQEFSFMNAIGDVDAKGGWQAALVIKDRRVTPEYGGGLCQVSTTMFRAAVYTGLPITERYPHSLPVAYYDPQGFDATVYSPHPDLRFMNDTPSNILVQTKIIGTKLYFEFYGTPDGRTVKLKGPVEYDKKPDGSLKATLERDIYKNGTLIKKDVFNSMYYSPVKTPQERNPLE